MSHRQLTALVDEMYEVFIDPTLEDGSLTFGECYLPGTTDEEVLISCPGLKIFDVLEHARTYFSLNAAAGKDATDAQLAGGLLGGAALKACSDSLTPRSWEIVVSSLSANRCA